MFIELENLFSGAVENEGIDLSFDFSDCEYNGVHPFVTPISLVGNFSNKAGIVEIDAEADFDFTAACDRCAEETTTHYSVPIKHTLVTSVNGENDDDYIIVEDMRLEIDRLTLEDIYLFLPSKYLCKEDCKGLCPKCGTNLNVKSCNCKKDIDPRWEALLSARDFD